MVTFKVIGIEVIGGNSKTTGIIAQCHVTCQLITEINMSKRVLGRGYNLEGCWP